MRAAKVRALICLAWRCHRRRRRPPTAAPPPRSSPKTQLWYLLYFASLSCIFPFLNLWLQRVGGLNPAQIGAIGCARPLASFPAGALWSGAADASRRHRAVLLLTLAASVLLRLAAFAASGAGFAALLALIVAAEACAAPVTIIVDALVMAACAQQADYGKQRLFGAIGWGICAALAGAAIQRVGLAAAFIGHAALAALVFAPTLALPLGPLHAKLERQAGAPARHGPGDGGGSGKAANGSEPPGEAGAGGGVARIDSALEAQALLRHHDSGGGKPAAAGEAAAAGAAVDGEGGGGKHGGAAAPKVHVWRGVRQLLSNSEAAIFLAQATFFGFGVSARSLARQPVPRCWVAAAGAGCRSKPPLETAAAARCSSMPPPAAGLTPCRWGTSKASCSSSWTL